MYQKICVYFAIFWLRKLNLLKLSEEVTPIKKWSASLNTLYYLLATRYLKWVSCLIRRSAKARALSVAVECSSDCYPQSILRPSLMGGIYLLKWFAKKSNPRIPIDIESRISNIESPLIMNRFERETSIINSLKTTSLTAQSYGESLWARRMQVFIEDFQMMKQNKNLVRCKKWKHSGGNFRSISKGSEISNCTSSYAYPWSVYPIRVKFARAHHFHILWSDA